jgi:hypothetical protein
VRTKLLPILAEPDVLAWIAKNGMVPAKSQQPDQLQEFMSADYTRWRGVLEKIGIAGSQ